LLLRPVETAEWMRQCLVSAHDMEAHEHAMEFLANIRKRNQESWKQPIAKATKQS
jgi:hypothetical protein